MVEQPRLFETAPTTNAPSKTFLSTNALFFAQLCKSPALNAAAKSAVSGNFRRHGDSRNAAAPFEDAFKDQLLDETVGSTIRAETIALCAAENLTVTDVQILPGKDKSLADIIVRYTGPHGTVAIATNIKRLLPDATHTEGGSILSFLRLALDPEYNPANPPTTRGYAWEQVIVEWLAGQHRIREGRDYMLLCVYASGRTFSGVDVWPVLSGTAGGAPIASRHSNRAVLDVSRPTGVIPPGYDINRNLARQLLPAPNPGAARALLLSLARAMTPGADDRRLAAALAAKSDAEIGAAALQAARLPEQLGQ
jgi:hypothetical protein